MNSTSPETVAGDSPALNVESPPLAATPPPEAETAGPSEGKIAPGRAAENPPGAKGGDAPEGHDGKESAAEAAVGGGKETKGDGVEGAGDRDEERQASPEKAEDKEGVEKESSSSESDSGSESDSSSGSSDSSSSDDEADSQLRGAEEEAEGGEVQSSVEKGGEGGVGETEREKEGGHEGKNVKAGLDTKGEAERERKIEEGGGSKEAGGLKGNREVGDRKESKEEKEGETARGTEIAVPGRAEDTTGLPDEGGFKAAVEVERMDDEPAGPAEEVERTEGGSSAEAKRVGSDVGASDRKRKESDHRDGDTVGLKKRKTDPGGLEEGEMPLAAQKAQHKSVEKERGFDEKVGKNADGLVRGGSKKQKAGGTDATKIAKDLPDTAAEGEGVAKEAGASKKQGLEKKGNQVGGASADQSRDVNKPTGGDSKKREKEKMVSRAEGGVGPAEGAADEGRGAKGPDGSVNERRASHAAAGPSGTEDVRSSSALSKFKAAQDKIAEQKASRKAIAIELEDQNALDRRKGPQDGVKRPLTAPSRGVSKGVKGLVKKSGLSKPGVVSGKSRGVVERAKGPGRAQVERLDDGGDLGPLTPLARSPKNGEKRKGEAVESSKKVRKEGGTKAPSTGAKESGKEPLVRKGNFGRSPLEEGELAPPPKKAKVGLEKDARGSAEKGGKPVLEKGGVASSEKGDKSGLGKKAKPTSDRGGLPSSERGGKDGGKAGSEKGAKHASASRGPAPKAFGKASPAGERGASGAKNAPETKGAASNGASKQAQNGVHRKGPAEPRASGANGTRVLSSVSMNGKASDASVQNGKGKGGPGQEVKKWVNGTKQVTEQDWLKYADVQPLGGRRTISSREQ
jgi:hypothetical protein